MTWSLSDFPKNLSDGRLAATELTDRALIRHTHRANLLFALDRWPEHAARILEELTDLAQEDRSYAPR